MSPFRSSQLHPKMCCQQTASIDSQADKTCRRRVTCLTVLRWVVHAKKLEGSRIKDQDYVYAKGEYFAKIMPYLRRETKVNKNKVESYFETLKYMQMHMYKHNQKQWKCSSSVCKSNKTSIISNCSTKNGPKCGSQVLNPRHQTPQGHSVANPGTSL